MRIIDAYRAIDMIDEWLDSVGTVLVGKGLSSYGELIGCIEDTPTLTLPNEPLTLDELREMDGEPVWFDTIKRWGIVKVSREGIFVATKSGEYEFGRCKVYRRPPEGEEDT